jgi:hypothetical protein
VSACGAFQRHAAIPEVQQEIMTSNGARDLTNRGTAAVDNLPEIAIVDCRQAKPGQDAKKHDVITRRKFDAPRSAHGFSRFWSRAW